MQEHVSQLAQMLAGARETYRRLQNEYQLRVQEHQALANAVTAAREHMQEVEDRLREEASIAGEGGDCNPAPGVTVRRITTLQYNHDWAFKWAKQKELALKLDVPAFERMAHADPAAFAPFVRFCEAYQSVIARDLTLYWPAAVSLPFKEEPTS